MVISTPFFRYENNKNIKYGVIIMIIRFFKKTIFLCVAAFLFVQAVLGHKVEDSIATAKKGALEQTCQSITYDMTYDLLYTCPLDSNKQIEVKKHLQYSTKYGTLA